LPWAARLGIEEDRGFSDDPLLVLSQGVLAVEVKPILDHLQLRSKSSIGLRLGEASRPHLGSLSLVLRLQQLVDPTERLAHLLLLSVESEKGRHPLRDSSPRDKITLAL